MKYLVCFCLSVVAVCTNLFAQDHFNVPAGTEIMDMHSEQSGRDYTLLINLPGSYADNPDKHYPVLYYTDAQWECSMLNSIVGKCNYDKTLPEMILVGISYPAPDADYDVLRSWDLTPVPTHEPIDPNHGGAPLFLQWIEEDLLPTVEAQYRVDPEARVWGGGSLGGLFSLNVLYEKPELFKRHIAISPAVIVDSGYTFRQDKAYAKKHDALVARLFICYGSREFSGFSDPIQQFMDQLEARHYEGLKLQCHIVEGARHGSVGPEGWTRGLWWAFEDLTPDVPGPLEEGLGDMELELDLGE